MRASKLITISTVAVLMGGTSLAFGQGGSSSLQNGAYTQGPPAIGQGSARSSETKGTNLRAAESSMRRGAVSGEPRSKVQGSQNLARGRAMIIERGRAITGQRSQAMAAERGQAAPGQQPKAGAQILGQSAARPRQPFGQKEGLVYARATASEARVGLSPDQRARLREIVAARQDLPRVSNLTGIRVNAVVPRNVRLAAIPEELARMYPRFRRHQAFIYRNELVVVDPATSRIVAVLPA
jgi:hypothetical protein